MSPFYFILVLASFIGKTAASLQSPLRSDYYKELTCPKEPIPLFSGKVNFIWLLAPGIRYIPMASERIYRLTAEILLGRAARSAAELDLVDIHVTNFSPGYKIKGFSGSKSFTKACFPTVRSVNTFPQNLLANVCYSLWGTRGSDIGPAAKAVDNIVWTDNENAVLFMPCNDESNSLDWFILSKRPTLSEATKAAVLTEITKFGFNTKNVAYYDYDNKRIIRSTSDIVVPNRPPVTSIPTYFAPSLISTPFVELQSQPLLTFK